MGLDSREFDYIAGLVRKQSAIVLEAGKEYLAESRLLPLAEQEGFSSLHEFVARLRSGPPGDLHRRVVEAMTTNETWFFRDDYPFQTLGRSLLPEIMKNRQREKELNIWSAACSSGQEPYSIAMTLNEHMPNRQDWKVRIIASDLSSEALERARAGRYYQLEVNRGVPATLLAKYFRQCGTEWEIREEIRQQVELCQINLIGPWPSLPPLDVVFLRNVLIYFDVESKRAILSRVRAVLRPDGYLFLGGAETTMNLDNAFERTEHEKGWGYRLRRPYEVGDALYTNEHRAVG